MNDSRVGEGTTLASGADALPLAGKADAAGRKSYPLQFFHSGLFVRPSDISTMRRVPIQVEWAPKVAALVPDSLDTEAKGASDMNPDPGSLIDFSVLNQIFENFLEVTGLPMSIIGLDGKVLASSRWQRLCLEFHRANAQTLAGCLKSDTILSGKMQVGGDWSIYQCANGLTDCATPIIIEGTHVANLFTGQFLLAPPDMAFFERQRAACGFEEAAYFKALSEIPIVSEPKIPAVLELLRGLAQQIARLSLAERKALTVLADVERQVAERTEKLAESESRFRTLFDEAPVGQLLIDPGNLQILECNQAAADIHACSRDEMRGMRVMDCDVALDEAQMASIRLRLGAGELVHFDTQVQRKNGERRDLSVTLVSLNSAHGERLLATHLDITERNRAENERRRLTRALRLLSDCNSALMRATNERQLLEDCCRLVVKSGGYLMSWVGVAGQDAAKTMQVIAQFGDDTGYLKSVRISWDGTQETGCGPTGTAVRTRTTQVNQNVLANERTLPWRMAAIERGYLSSAALPLVTDHQMLGVLTLYAAEPGAFSSDEIGLLEELSGNVAYGLLAVRRRSDLERHQKHLEDLVTERTHEIFGLNAELKARVMEAEAANRAKSEFLSTMSHELRTPLNAVVGFTGLLADSSLNRAQRDFANKILSSAQALRALIDDILDFSKIEAGALQLELAPFSLNAILRATAAVVSIGTRDKPIEPLFDVAPDIADAFIGDSLRLQQILLNLISNAVKYTERGVIVVEVRCVARQAGEVSLQFAIRDTGIGIPAEQQERIFEMFTQADSSTSRQYGGTGLGLPISARLAALMGGTISVESAVRWGSEFAFTVPLALAANQPPEPVVESPSGLRILIVDDHAMVRDVLTRTCTRFGWRATAVGSGEKGLAELRLSLANARDYDLILLDWRMPGMSGVEMLRQAYASPDIALPLVVLMAATFELEQAAAGCDDLHLEGILAKPVMPETLFEAVQSAYSGKPTDLMPPLRKTDRRLAGMQLLVVEDNELNQQVIEQILVRAGAAVVIGANGRAAIEALSTPGAHFDAVLMDIQMPEMDGYSATRIIRQELGLVNLPIIAITAHARPEDRERSREAGMLGHLVKPIDVDDLLDVIAGNRRDAKDIPKAGSVWEVPGLDAAAILATFGGDAKGYASLLRQFLGHHGGDVDKASHLIGAGNLQEASRLFHEMRGVAGFLQAKQVARLAGSIEDALACGKIEALTPLLADLQGAMETVKTSVDQLEAMGPPR